MILFSPLSSPTFVRIKEFVHEHDLRNRPHALIWLSKVYGISAGMYACQVWGTEYLREGSEFKSQLQKRQLCSLRRFLGVKITATNWPVLREGRDRPTWRVPHDAPAAEGGLVIGQVWSSWDASFRQETLLKAEGVPCGGKRKETHLYFACVPSSMTGHSITPFTKLAVNVLTEAFFPCKPCKP
eukprot:1156242-Pelagomonas_calceolata.AAC.2